MPRSGRRGQQREKSVQVLAAAAAAAYLLVGGGCLDPRGGESVEARLVHVARDDVLRLRHLRRAPPQSPARRSADKFKTGCEYVRHDKAHASDSASIENDELENHQGGVRPTSAKPAHAGLRDRSTAGADGWAPVPAGQPLQKVRRATTAWGHEAIGSSHLLSRGCSSRYRSSSA